METSGPGIARDAVGPLRRALLDPGAPLPAPRSRRLRAYGVPVGLFALIGLGLANMAYLEDARSLASFWSVTLSIGAVAPVAVAVRRPLLAWRIAYPLLFLGTVQAKPTESWPWSPVHIVAFLVVLALVAVAEDGAVSFWVAGLSVVPPFVYADRGNAFGVALLFAAIALVGDLVSRRRRTRAQLAEQAELTELERARRAVLEERTRIAREMHDVVAHHMSMIAVRAETAPFRVGELSDPARAELAGIASSARSALADMRRLLGVLRADTETAAREPQPGLAELPELVASARRAGVPVTWSMDGGGAVPEPVALAAYRILQEALANAARHAPGSSVNAAVRALPDRLEVEVRNAPPAAGPAPGPAGAGHGLTGMRERAELLGGTLTAAPDADGGYAVTASLPYRGEPS